MEVLALVALILAASPPASAEVPFVGCPTDGQQGPQPAPRSGRVPRVAPAAAAAQLAYYATSELGVLAPRGWSCQGLAGSNGSSLIVTPAPHTADALLGRTERLRGPAVQMAVSFGGTSGRFEVANVIARAFPAHMDFARRVAAEGARQALPSGPYPADRMVRLRANAVGYRTPPGRHGLGTDSWLAPDDQPIDGVAILDTSGDWALVKLDVRLAPAQASLATPILNAALPPRAARR
jgi:hypothetical protein